MRIVTWNINGIRATRAGVRELLDSLEADIICLQETKVTRDLLDEPTAVVEGYNSYFSFSRGRSGYSGVATFCRDTATPLAAEEGLSGLLTGHAGAVGCYGNLEEFSEEELQALDNEGRAVITRHKILTGDEQREETLTVINVYCPRADPEKPERKAYKQRFYHLLQTRAEAILHTGGHVIVLGDVNTSHRTIDHCDPKDPEFFEENPGRKWLNQFLARSDDATELVHTQEEEELLPSAGGESGGLFLDSFRFFHPMQRYAFTCWCTTTGARQTNYGTRIDYIFGDRVLVERDFQESVLMSDVEGSDHCPVKAFLKCRLVAASRCPPLCTKYLPEFAGKQQKLSQFLVKIERKPSNGLVVGDALPSSQDASEVTENRPPASLQWPPQLSQKQSKTDISKKGAKKQKTAHPRGQGSLLCFFRPAESRAGGAKATEVQKEPDKEEQVQESECKVQSAETAGPEDVRTEAGTAGGPAKPQAAFWKTVLKGPAPPPPCKGHGEPCVLRTVKKAGPNCGKQFYVCGRPEGHSSNPEARCNFFLWVSKKTPTTG